MKDITVEQKNKELLKLLYLYIESYFQVIDFISVDTIILERVDLETYIVCKLMVEIQELKEEMKKLLLEVINFMDEKIRKSEKSLFLQVDDWVILSIFRIKISKFFSVIQGLECINLEQEFNIISQLESWNKIFLHYKELFCVLDEHDRYDSPLMRRYYKS